MRLTIRFPGPSGPPHPHTPQPPFPRVGKGGAEAQTQRDLSTSSRLTTRLTSWLTLGLAAALVGCGPAPRAAEARPGSPAPTPSGPFELYVLDVGTGLAVLARGEGFALLYDGGSNDDRKTGPKNRLLAYLEHTLGPSPDEACRAEQGLPPPAARASEPVLDLLVLSHPHRDHYALLPDVLRCARVRRFWGSGRVSDAKGVAALEQALAAEPGLARHEPPRSLARGDALTLGAGARAVVLHADPEARDANDASLVVRLDLGGVRVLLPGDATGGERRAADDGAARAERGSPEARLLERPDELRADVLVLGHHGSLTSSRRAFLEAVRPRVALVSSGPMRYGSVRLPDEAVLGEVRRVGARVYRTDEGDEACASAPRKVGPPADGGPGGCSAYRVAIEGTDVRVTPFP
jgi:beta-lactamase superfamily II metal-dependent hydrolase